jgi:hypothetical protein
MNNPTNQQQKNSGQQNRRRNKIKVNNPKRRQNPVNKLGNRLNNPPKNTETRQLLGNQPATNQGISGKGPAELHYAGVHHERRRHPKKQHDHFKEDLENAINLFESSKQNYANTLLYPEVFMSRIPFICPVPTAIARGVAIYSFVPDTSVGDTFAWSFVPEAIAQDSGA